MKMSRVSRSVFVIGKNTKHQTSNSKKPPNSKSQSGSATSCLPECLPVFRDHLGVWDLGVRWFLEFGIWCFTSGRRRRRHVFDEQRNARLGLSVQRDVHGVKPRLVELQLLKVDDEIARP